MIEKLISTAPGLAVAVIMMWAFLKHLRGERKGREATEQRRIAEWIRISENCHDHTRELNERACQAIDKSAAMNEKTLTMLGSIGETMKGCADRVNGKG